MTKPQWTDHDRESVEKLLFEFWKIGSPAASEYVSALEKFFPSTALRCIREHFQNAENNFKPAAGALSRACADYAKQAYQATKKPDDDRRRSAALAYLIRCSYFDAIVEWRGAVWKLERAGLMLIADPQNRERETERGYLGGIKPYTRIPIAEVEHLSGTVQMDAEDRAKVSDESRWHDRPLHEHFDRLRAKSNPTEAERWLLSRLTKKHQARNVAGFTEL